VTALPGRSFRVGIGVGVVLTLLGTQIAAYYWLRHMDTLTEAPRPAPRRPSGVQFPAWREFPPPFLPDSAALNLYGEAHRAWQLRDRAGRTVRLADFQGKVVVLNFWATGCPPCVAELGGFLQLRESLAGEPVVFLFVTDEEPKQVRKFLAEANVPASLRAGDFPVYFRQGDPPDVFRYRGIPITFVLDRDGAVVARVEDIANWDTDNVRRYLRSLAR